MKAFISKRAGQAAERIKARWRLKGDDPELFQREFLAAIEHIQSVESPGTRFPTAKRPDLKRVLLPKSHCHIYFEINARKQMLHVLHVWDGRRERGPKL